ncbi:MAG: protein jag [Firmicutes bacterium]|nr:protein jag [Bacillota bacterium]
MRSSEKWGVDVDTAVNLALKELKLERDEVEIEVLEESSNGFLGIGSKLAKVRVTAKETAADNKKKEKATFDDIDAILASLPENATASLDDDVREDFAKFEQEEREDARARAKEKKKEINKNRKASKKQTVKTPVIEDILLEEVKGLDSVEEHPVKDFLAEIADKMGIDLAFDVKAGDGLVYVEITGKDTGTIIGKRGATLDAVQCLAGYVVNKDTNKYVRVILDAENYRRKREKTLVNLANRLAQKVDRSKKSVTLEPMNPYERKVIHTTLQNHPRVKTRSEGKDPYRKVIIEHK